MSNVPIDRASFGKWLKKKRLEHNWSLTQLAEKLYGKVTLRTLTRIENEPQHRDSRWDTVSAIGELFGLKVQQVVDEVNMELTPPLNKELKKPRLFEIEHPWNDFLALTNTILEIDHIILKNFRSQSKAPYDTLFHGYAASLKGSLVDFQMSLDDLFKLLCNRTYLTNILSTIPNSMLAIKVEKYLKSLAFGFDNSVLLIHSPELLWDCHCRTPTLKDFEIDAVRYLTKDCPIHGNEYGSQIDHRFKNNLIEIEYDNLAFLWKRSDEFWPPSMDTFTMLLDLEKASVFQKKYSTALDLGCGTGILGMAVAKRNPHIISVTLVDWLLTPLVYTAINWMRNIPVSTKQSFFLLSGLNTQWVTNPEVKTFDLALCNPPYLPIPEQFRDLKMSSTVAGTELLENFIANSSSFAKDCFVSFSHLAKPEADNSAKRSRKRLRPIAEPRRVPFRLLNAFEKIKYMRWLIKERGLLYQPRLRHRFWHFLTTYKVEPL